LFLAVPVLGVWTFAIAPEHAWWFPRNVSTFGQDIDRLYTLIQWLLAAFFVLTEGLLALVVLRFARKRADKAWFAHGDSRIELAWTLVPGALLIALAFAQWGTWRKIKFVQRFPSGAYSVDHPLARVVASQFDWRFVYPGDDGSFGTADDLENPFELVVPVATDVVLELESRDVIHSFFVPRFRLKQDALPGQKIPVWFDATEVGEYDLVCAELCGFGHYKMAGRVRVVSRDEYERWLESLKAHWRSNGSAGAP
jgi:cytochrome c oxidase subunit 2